MLSSVLLLLLLPSSAGARESLDANCPGPRDAGHAAPADGRFAQDFRAEASGLLTSAQVDVTNNAGSADWIVQVVSVDATGTPSNTVLTSAIVPDDTVPVSNSTLITATFNDPAAVVGGRRYALVLTRPGSGAGSLQVGGRSGDVCAGRLFFSNTQTDGFSTVGVADMVFAVFVEPDDDPPQTRITKAPPNRGERNRVKYRFVSDEPDSTFECKVDRRRFKPCTSPRRFRVKNGRHKFKVRATDPSGNTDPTAGRDKFRVTG